MRHNSSPFKWRHYAPDIILLCVRWYCRYSLSYRDVEEVMRERGLTVGHVTVFGWVQRYAPELNKRMRPHLKMSGASYPLGETYVKVGKSWKYLYRAVDKDGATIESMLSAKRDVPAAKRFFKKLMRAEQRRLPFTVGTDKHASYPETFATSVKEKMKRSLNFSIPRRSLASVPCRAPALSRVLSLHTAALIVPVRLRHARLPQSSAQSGRPHAEGTRRARLARDE
jgi:transposase-like protein